LYRNEAEVATEQVRTGFGRLAVAVAVITAWDGDQPHGCTGMAWAEHVEPPLLLTTLRHAGHTRKLVATTGRFGVNVLGEAQAAYTHRFAATSPQPRGGLGQSGSGPSGSGVSPESGVPEPDGPEPGVPEGSVSPRDLRRARFAGVAFSPGGALGVPLLDGCVASFECEVNGIYPFGGHDIVVGRVAGASVPEGGFPVVHYGGQLWGLREAAR
jgi:flavin reductase (DIM6/NTAB) family NADH-FMN oxidoreductase RutF